MKKNLALVALLSMCLSSCKDKDEARQILPDLNAAFPNSAIFKFDNRLLWIQTQVSGVSKITAEQLYIVACERATKNFGPVQINLQAELSIDNKQYFLVGISHIYIGWDVRNGVNARGVPMHALVMNEQEKIQWVRQRLGYYPSTDHIFVERLIDLQNTPNNQPIQLATLATLQKRKMEEVQQELDRAKMEADGSSN